MIPKLHQYQLDNNVTAFSTMRSCDDNSLQAEDKVNDAYASFNINPWVEDSEEQVSSSRLELAKALEINEKNIILPHQTHQTEVRQIASEFLSLPTSVQTMLLEGVDALITNEPNVCIGVSTADCVPVMMYDAEHKAIAVAHAGWRGTVENIMRKTVEKMYRSFNTDPKTLQVVIGPSISFESFEVGSDVFNAFNEKGLATDKQCVCSSAQLPSTNNNNVLVDNSAKDNEPKWHIDLAQCNKKQLESLGVPAQNITLSGICTYSNHHKYFSARRLGTASGRIYTGIILRG